MTDIEGYDRHAIIEALKKHQGSMSDERFCRRWLHVAPSSWYRIKNSTYGAKNWEAILQKLAGALRSIEDAAVARQISSSRRVLAMRHIKAVAAAVAEATHEPRDRLVVFLGPTGSGKSKMAEWLNEYYAGSAVKVEATESWKECYMSAAGGIGRALSIKDDVLNSRWAAEASILDSVHDSPRIFIVDEAHHMGPSALNLIKAILNAGAPGTVVVLLAIPALWERMCKRSWAEAEQLRNRAKAVIRASECLEPEDLCNFLRDRFGMESFAALAADQDKVIELIRQTVRRFGAWAAAERLAAAAVNIAGDGLVTLADVEAAVAEQVSLS